VIIEYELIQVGRIWGTPVAAGKFVCFITRPLHQGTIVEVGILYARTRE
jgi:hypothetical protein